jgi:hypothetical protein
LHAATLNFDGSDTTSVTKHHSIQITSFMLEVQGSVHAFRDNCAEINHLSYVGAFFCDHQYETLGVLPGPIIRDAAQLFGNHTVAAQEATFSVF